MGSASTQPWPWPAPPPVPGPHATSPRCRFGLAGLRASRFLLILLLLYTHAASCSVPPDEHAAFSPHPHGQAHGTGVLPARRVGHDFNLLPRPFCGGTQAPAVSGVWPGRAALLSQGEGRGGQRAIPTSSVAFGRPCLVTLTSPLRNSVEPEHLTGTSLAGGGGLRGGAPSSASALGRAQRGRTGHRVVAGRAAPVLRPSDSGPGNYRCVRLLSPLYQF